MPPQPLSARFKVEYKNGESITLLIEFPPGKDHTITLWEGGMQVRLTNLFPIPFLVRKYSGGWVGVPGKDCQWVISGGARYTITSTINGGQDPAWYIVNRDVNDVLFLPPYKRDNYKIKKYRLIVFDGTHRHMLTDEPLTFS